VGETAAITDNSRASRLRLSHRGARDGSWLLNGVFRPALQPRGMPYFSECLATGNHGQANAKGG